MEQPRRELPTTAPDLEELPDKLSHVLKRIGELHNRLAETLNSTSRVADKGARRIEEGAEALKILGQVSGQLAGITERVRALEQAVAGAMGSASKGVVPPPTPAASPELMKLAQRLSSLDEFCRAKLGKVDSLDEVFERLSQWVMRVFGDERRLKAVLRLPDLFDLVEMELNSWRRDNAPAEPLPERDAVRKELEMLQRWMGDWQKRVGVVRFPKPGDPFDITCHDTVDVAETEDASLVGKIKEVRQSGYGFDGESPMEVLRRARVVRWVPPRVDGAPGSGG